MIIFAGQTLTMVIREWGTEEQKDRLFGKISSGDKVNAFSLTEPNYGSESASIQTTAVLDGDYYIVNGTKIFVTNGDIADFVLLFVRTGEGERHMGLWIPFFTERPSESKNLKEFTFSHYFYMD